MTKYTPEHLKNWTRPRDYMGETYENYYVFLGQNRDSDVLVRANFQSVENALSNVWDTLDSERLDRWSAEHEDEPMWLNARASHWAVGWVEAIMIHEEAYELLQEADKIAAAIDVYPVIDDELYSKMEHEEVVDTLENVYGLNKLGVQLYFEEVRDSQDFDKELLKSIKLRINLMENGESLAEDLEDILFEVNVLDFPDKPRIEFLEGQMRKIKKMLKDVIETIKSD